MNIDAQQLLEVIGAKEAELYFLRDAHRTALARIAELEVIAKSAQPAE